MFRRQSASINTIFLRKKTEEIISFCKEKQIPFVGKIPLDGEVAKAQNRGESVVHTDCPASRAIREIYEQIKNL